MARGTSRGFCPASSCRALRAAPLTYARLTLTIPLPPPSRRPRSCPHQLTPLFFNMGIFEKLFSAKEMRTLMYVRPPPPLLRAAAAAPARLRCAPRADC